MSDVKRHERFDGVRGLDKEFDNLVKQINTILTTKADAETVAATEVDITESVAAVASSVATIEDVANHKFRVYLSADQDYDTTDDIIIIGFDTDSFSSSFDTVNNKFVVTSAGHYLLSIRLRFQLYSPNETVELFLYKNGVNISAKYLPFPAIGGIFSVTFNDLQELALSDELEVYISGSANFTIISSTENSFFYGCKVN